MSGHNPHSHLSQPNSSWNPLQIPSYIPRQPQLAHMSNERPLVRSPLTWHSPAPPTPPDAFYSFLSANHKSLELNPLLPSFVRGPPPFGSVDLTIQTARNSTTPSSRNLTSPPPSHQDFSAHNKPQQPPFPPQHHPHHQAHQQQIPRCITPNNLNSCNIPPSTGTGVIQSTGSVRDKFQCSTSNGSNSGDLPQATPAPGSIFIRDARQINSDLAKMASREPSAMEVTQLQMNEPVELIKENPYQSTKSHTAVPTSPKRLSPTRPSSISNSTPLSPSPRSPLTTLSNTGSATDLVNNHIMNASGNGIPLLTSQKPEPNVVQGAASMSSENSPLPLTLPPSPTTTTSNEDSVDSQTSKSRRKRKPNKTTRVSNDSDESMQERDSETSSLKRASTPNEQAEINPLSEKNDTLIDLDSNKVISSNRNEIVDMTTSSNTTCQSDSQGNQEPISFVTSEMPAEQAAKDIAPSTPTERLIPDNNIEESASAETTSQTALELCRRAPTPIPDEPHSVIVNNTNVNLVNRNESKSPTGSDHGSKTNVMETCQAAESLPTLETPVPCQDIDRPSSAVDESTTSNPPIQSAPVEPSLESPRRRTKRKGDSDDIETIDKIAAMIASTQSSDEPSETVMPSDDNLDVLSKEIEEQQEKQSENEPEAQLNKAEPETSKISDLTEILGTPPSGSSPNHTDSGATSDQQEVKLNVVENCFEEVENKLEEMFAGIEDGEPPPCILPAPTIDEPITPEVISELGLGGIVSPLKQVPAEPTIAVEETTSKAAQDKDDTSSKSSSHHNSSQKRSHNSNNKVESTPPNKKRKVSKKSTQSSSSSTANQKHSTSTLTKSSKPHSSSASASNSSKPSKSAEKQSSSSSATKDTKIKEEPATVEYKGPFIHLKSDGTINVINAPTTEDVVEKQNKVKKSIHSHSHSDRNKIRGLHVSTLSTKYDADTTDTSWMCVFCKRGPHKVGLGDLFGPYIVTTTCEGFAYSQKDPNDDEFVSKRTKADMYQKHVNGMPVVPASTSSLAFATSAMLNTSSSSPSTSKKKRKNNDSPSIVQIPTPSTSSSFDVNDIYVGMTKVSDTSYEVWVHEDCVVWSSGVYIIGSRIVGLDTAVWSSTRYKCSICSKNGAMTSCLQRGCSEKAHISCARLDNWDVNESEFKCTCSKHPTASLDTS